MHFHIGCQPSSRTDVSNVKCIKTELVSGLTVLLLVKGRGRGVMWNVRLVWQKGCLRLCADLTIAHIMSKPEENLNLKKN